MVAADLAGAVPDLGDLLNGYAVERVATVAALRRVVADTRPDCVVVTCDGPNGAWRRGVAAVCAVEPALPVVLVASDGSERLAAAAVEADVAAYVNLAAESDPGGRLAAAVEAAVERGSGDGPTGNGSDAEQARIDHYRTLVETAGDPMYVLDADGTLQMYNGAMAERVGYESGDLVGSSVERFTTPDSVATADAALQRLFANGGGTHETVEIDLVTAADERVPCEVSLAPIRDDDGAFAGSVGVVRDINRRTRKRELERYKRIFETVPDVLFVFDADGIVETTNERATEVFGIDRADLIGRSYAELLDAEVFGWEAVNRYLETVARLLDSDTDAPGRFEVTLTTPDGRDRTYEVHVTLRSVDGEFHGTVGVMRDITERTRREAELERQNERLERFASVVSHDLRNPLEVARGRLELAQEHGDDRHLEHVDGALDRMETIVDDLLALARQGTAVQDTQLVRLDRTARAAWEVVETGDATLTVASDCPVRADGSRLQQLFENCFRNAVEHGSTSPDSQARQDAVEHGSTGNRNSQSSGDVAEETSAGHRTESDDAVEHGDRDDASAPTVSVRVGLLYDDGQPDGFYVEDDGPGIPVDQRDHLFEYGTAGSDGGMGLGLAIVEDIVDAHGWRIRVADGADRSGARFEVTGVTVREQ
ncbi:PAS domain S-box protein [Halorientalis pallida]|uniref:histidine kinase n=1 Tax=Halorientalis pallida TaxID=2479928 RepID=A0A498KRC9_9EURY|nr:PAS domain S-box protein [Halorientalis pallida]RXK46883.1 PAS domain S-box protein [Halorientalis pallida]